MKIYVECKSNVCCMLNVNHLACSIIPNNVKIFLIMHFSLDANLNVLTIFMFPTSMFDS